MGVMMRDACVRYEECHTAWLNEREFAEVARTLKALAVEQGLATDPIINELVHFGVDAAYALLCVQTELESGRDTIRASSGRDAKPAGLPLVH